MKRERRKKMEEMIKVVCGGNTQELGNLVGKNVAKIRKTLKDSLNIPDEAIATISGNNVENNYLLKDGDVLEFVRPSGAKG